MLKCLLGGRARQAGCIYSSCAAHSDNLAQRPGTMARMEAHYIFAIAAMALAIFCSQATAATWGTSRQKALVCQVR